MATLNHAEVEKLLQSYDSKEVTNQLYEMGKTLMEEAGERLDYLDSKTARIAGYVGAIVGLLVSTFPIWTSAVDRWGIILVAVGTLIGAVGGLLALRSLWPRRLSLLSDSDWLEQDGLKDPDRLKKYYVSSLHLAITSQEKVAASKGSAIKLSQACLAVMLVTLLVALGNATYKTATHASSPQSSDHADVEGSVSYPR